MSIIICNLETTIPICNIEYKRGDVGEILKFNKRTVQGAWYRYRRNRGRG
jgi:hypothetical protein